MAVLVSNPTIVSNLQSGDQANGASSRPLFLNNGSIAFASEAGNFGTGGVNAAPGIYSKDLTTGAITPISTDMTGIAGNNISESPVVSSDGSKVIFASTADNLVTGDTNAQEDIFLKDLTTGNVTLLSSGAGLTASNAASLEPTISGNGTTAAFTTSASNLGPADVNGVTDIYVRDLATGNVTLASSLPTEQANGASSMATLSNDASKLAFVSSASNLVADDTNGVNDVFVKDMVTGDITRISTDATGTQSLGASSTPVFSADGTKVAFVSAAGNLVSGDTNGSEDIFVKDLATGAVTRVSTGASDAEGNGISGTPVFSPDGHLIAFTSAASNLSTSDHNNATDVFVKDLTTGETTLVSHTETGASGNGASSGPVFSPDGTTISFVSDASDLVASDTNQFGDVFTATLQTGDNGGGGGTGGGGGSSGSHFIKGTVGDDILSGGSDQDIISGKQGADTINAGDGNDTVNGGSGRDILAGEGGDDIMLGGSGGDTIRGGDGNDALHGGGSGDILMGEGGDDILYGDMGTDKLTGGAGNDVFVVDSVDGHPDKIRDFKVTGGETDAIRLDHILTGFDPIAGHITDFVTKTEAGNNTTLLVDRDGTGTAYSAEPAVVIMHQAGLDIQQMYDTHGLVVA